MPRLRPVPWLMLADLAVAARHRWTQLHPTDRRRLAELVRRARHLDERERRELRSLVGKLDLVGMGRELLPLGRRARRRRRR